MTLHTNTKLKEKPNFGADLVWQTWGALRGEKICGASGICIWSELMLFYPRTKIIRCRARVETERYFDEKRQENT